MVYVISYILVKLDELKVYIKVKPLADKVNKIESYTYVQLALVVA
jgi:hypothetical protein